MRLATVERGCPGAKSWSGAQDSTRDGERVVLGDKLATCERGLPVGTRILPTVETIRMWATRK